MIQRLLTSAIGIVIFFLILPAKTAIFSVAVLLITLGAVFELHNAVTKNKLLFVIGLISSFLVSYGAANSESVVWFFMVFAIYMVLSVVLYGKEKVSEIYILGFLTVIISFFLTTLTRTKILFSTYEVFLPFLFAWITDSGAYFAGKTMGKTKLAPQLSPKKTVEGSFGGVIACVLCSLLYVFVLDKAFDYSVFGGNDYILISLIALVTSIASQFGDLALSAIKRDFGIKDYGNILPGHGGILDRFDSVLFAAPVVFYYLYYIV